jgi:Dolichyl-phosphate-mannose-protein mannosyltransferase
MQKRLAWRPALRSDTALLLSLAGVALVLHFLSNGRYGYFRDELYYIACGRHLAWGYVDQPPLVAVAARVSRAWLGHSLFAIRFFPAVAAAAAIFLTGLIARELGGGRFAQGLAALAILVAPAYLAFGNFLSMNAFEPVFWMLCVWLAIRIVKGGDERLWLVFGLVAGVGLLNKNSMLLFGYAFFVGLLLTRARRAFYSKWIWLGALAAFAIFLPNLLWQWRHGWPQIQVVLNAQLYKNTPTPPAQFLLEQILFMHPLTLPVWLAGLGFFLASDRGREFRFLGWTYLVLLGLFLALKGKSYYLLPAYPMLVAAGAVAIEQALRAPQRLWIRRAAPALLVLGGILTLPYGLPVLPVRTFIRYEAWLPLARPVQVERDAPKTLPQLYADMFGWQNMVAAVGRVYGALPAAERRPCAILAENYGEAGAVDLFGPRYGLPRAISGHNNYYLWGPGNFSGQVVISVGVPRAELARMFREIRLAAIVTNPYAMPVENDLRIYVCQKPKAPLRQMWPITRYYI